MEIISTFQCILKLYFTAFGIYFMYYYCVCEQMKTIFIKGEEIHRQQGVHLMTPAKQRLSGS